jgi:TonB family protein
MALLRWIPAALLLPAALLFTASLATAQVPDAPLPAAPAAPASAPAPAKPGAPSLTVPPPSYERPTGLPPRRDAGFYCYAPPEGIFSSANRRVPTEVRGLMQGYMKLVSEQIFGEWDHHMSPMEKNAWAKGRFVALRFAINPDGTHTTPSITHTSNSARDDQHALDAIKASSPFSPLPGHLNRPFPICVVMGYHLDPSALPLSGSQEWEDAPAP